MEVDKGMKSIPSKITSFVIISIVIIFFSKYITSQLIWCGQINNKSKSILTANQLVSSIDEATKPHSENNPLFQYHKSKFASLQGILQQ